MTKHSGEWNMYLRNPLTKELAVVHNWDDVIKLNEQGYVKIGRAQWRQLKRLERISKGISKALVKDEHDLR